MRRHRTTAVALLAAVLFGLAAGSSAAQPHASTAAAKGIPQLIFPIVGQATYGDDYGDPRGQGRHDGNDIMSVRRAPAVAVEDGTVKFHTTSWRAGCMLYLDGASGTQYLYIHLNNDLTAANDNRGKCVPGVAYARGLKSDTRVTAGQTIGFVGDSGDADGIEPHLHFEVHPGGGASVNPYGHSHRNRNARRVSGVAVGKGPEISHVGLSGRGRSFLVSPLPDGLEEGVRSPAAELESVNPAPVFLRAGTCLVNWLTSRPAR